MNTKLVAVGTPEELRESLFARTTIVQSRASMRFILTALRNLGVGRIEVANGNKLIIGVKDPDKENPDIVHAIDAAGGRIRSVYQSNPTLEDVYLKLIRSVINFGFSKRLVCRSERFRNHQAEKEHLGVHHRTSRHHLDSFHPCCQ